MNTTIIDRLNIIVKFFGLTNSQFADAIGMPKPSVSQILSGRNKKVSNEFIGRVHEAFPNLNILWLLFGDGNIIFSKEEEQLGHNLYENVQRELEKDPFLVEGVEIIRNPTKPLEGLPSQKDINTSISHRLPFEARYITSEEDYEKFVGNSSHNPEEQKEINQNEENTSRNHQNDVTETGNAIPVTENSNEKESATEKIDKDTAQRDIRENEKVVDRKNTSVIGNGQSDESKNAESKTLNGLSIDGKTKEITSIIVYFNDNTYQVFKLGSL